MSSCGRIQTSRMTLMTENGNSSSREQTLEELRSAQKLLVVTHENPDGDALGSLVAMLLVVGAVTALSTFVFHTTLGIGPGLVSLIIAATSIVTMVVAMLVAWGAVRVRPLDVLRYE